VKTIVEKVSTQIGRRCATNDEAHLIEHSSLGAVLRLCWLLHPPGWLVGWCSTYHLQSDDFALAVRCGLVAMMRVILFLLRCRALLLLPTPLPIFRLNTMQ
jgi:hypothetical protein